MLVLMSDVTQILSQIEQGDPTAAEQLLPLVYEELRKLAAAKLAHEKPGQTLQATALVHEAYLRLVDVEKAQQWDSRGHFFAAAAEAMRRILLNRARDKRRLKEGGGRRKVDFDQIQLALDTPGDDLVALDDAIEALGEKIFNVLNLLNCGTSAVCRIRKRRQRLESLAALRTANGPTRGPGCMNDCGKLKAGE